MIRTKQKALAKRAAADEAMSATWTAADWNDRHKRKPGRPPSGKIMVTLRLDPDVVAKFKASGAGWQARMNEALARASV